jgi:chromosomal replication initiation ATPase DnaA
MAEAALRKLDRDLPRLDMRSPRLRDKQAKRLVPAKPKARSRMTDREKRRADAAMHAALLAVDRAKELAEANVARAAAIIDDAEQRAAEIIAAAETEAAEILKRGGVPVREIILEVARRHDVDPELITGRSHNARIVAIRYEAISLAHLRRPDMTLPQLARAFGDRDHTTILHALKKTGAYLGRKAIYGERE